MLTVEGLRVRYGAIEVVHGIDLRVERGEAVAIVGANGAGKTSTLNALSGVVPAAGRVVLDGRDLSRAPAHARVRAGLVQVPEGRQVLARMSVEENLEMGRSARRERTGPAIADMYGRFPILGERRRLPAGQLSGGEQQLLALARALLAAPVLLLLDEPSLGLAPLAVAEVFDSLARLRADGVTMLLVEQNVHRALNLADRALVMELGRITRGGTSSELRGDPAIAEAYLGARA